VPTAVAARSNAWVCGRSLAEIVSSNPARSWMSVCYERCVLSGRGLCVGLITRPEESYRVCCVWVWWWSFDNEEVVEVVWALLNDAVGRHMLGFHSGVAGVFVLQGCDASSHCNRFPKIWDNGISCCTFPTLYATTVLCRIVGNQLPSECASYRKPADALKC
jgi:hypothetical protein